ncbi:von Willebrand factor A domain-containing protein 7-like [Paramisgurnus dabryanus]|uniref:von Willebrand factor A domain-containing protein 7-like n=1 Tax=Paramisgurnus dabryanus TaxID=90735 RepID=UPI0031F39C46
MIIKSSLSTVAVVALLVSSTHAFMSFLVGNENTHVTITSRAIMAKLYEVCEAVAKSEGRSFNPTGPSVEELLHACLGMETGEGSGARFRAALNQIYMQNVIVDRDFMTSAPHHFNNEAFSEGHNLIIQGIKAIKDNVRNDNIHSARETLGRVCHTLQDFYSHSNWVELGKKSPYANLIRPDLNIENIADRTMPTCSDCASGNCPNNLLPAILNGKYLTSGYMGLYSPDKPQGKCSHGGDADLSSAQIPRGGISKDEMHSYNADLHNTAVNLAAEATTELLEDIRAAIGNNDFLRLMGITRSVVLAFVIDTTASMAVHLDNIKKVAGDVIDKKKGTQDEPSEYILVSCNEPDFGPLIRTTNPDVMKAEISNLKASSGGKGMCLSSLRLALTGAPPSLHIYVFTEDSPNDIGLEKSITTLIRSTKSTVSFIVPLFVRKTMASVAEPRSEFQVYHDLALASGGQAIEVRRTMLTQTTDIIADTCTSKLVTILQRSRNPGRVESFPFLLDEFVSNVTIYITGNNLLLFTIRSPSGVSQSNAESGKLGSNVRVGNLERFKLKVTEMGVWYIDMRSTQPYSIKVTGQSTITFIYDFVEEFKGPHPGYAVIDERPLAGLPAKLLLTLTDEKGPEVLEVQEVSLVEVSGNTVSTETVEKINDGEVLVTVKEFPEGEFAVLLNGINKISNSPFQRQTTIQMSPSKLTIKVMADGSMHPGQKYDLPYTLTTNGASGVYTIRAMNDKDYIMKHTSKLNLVSGGSAVGIVSLSPPADTVSGTDVTLIIEAEGPGGIDYNYAVLRLSVVSEVTDFTPPQCKWFSQQGHCTGYPCDISNWTVSVNITDGNGVESVSVLQGGGYFNQTPADDGVISMVLGHYESSCCRLSVALRTIDNAGNTDICTYIYENDLSAGSALSGMTLTLWACLLASAMIVLCDTFNL